MNFILLVIGFVFLIKWADMLVDGASSVAKKFGISGLVIGLTIVAFWTSAPELVVNMMSAFRGETQLAISNILGSNVSNILLILWITAIVYPIAMPNSTIKKEIPFVIFSSILLLLVLLDWELSRMDAGILGVFFAGFVYYTFSIAKEGTSQENNNEDNEVKTMTSTKSIIFILLWLAGLVGGWKLIVDSAVAIAQWFGLPMSFIGVTIVAIGTSLPELAASVVAALKKQTDMAIWGVVGSNIFNTLWILWATGLVSPLAWYSSMNIDLYVVISASVLLFLSAFVFGKKLLSKTEWIIFVLLYISYLWYLSYNVL